MSETVAILGASNKPDRYAFLAQSLLQEHGHTVVPINPKEKEINGVSCFTSLAEYSGKLDTVTLYVGPNILSGLVSEIIQAKPTRVIMNPGTESESAKQQLISAGIKVEEACTLVLLRTGQYD
ncbi:CoA-binding protein [Vibrio sp.]|uniref:CoA-binding protein n=1 Tax=Vibrio viridaestus TaxID=2487322 RepID=A0A3N9TE14_9VIBR|nr:CoA-binding protein [Vibrio viridaestus]MDC0609172.1 CoA-binding protein [Vibrio sp.]RQW62329.1 CoA-binding protein [Vibrio viridaestus]